MQLWRLVSPNLQCGPAGWKPRKSDAYKVRRQFAGKFHLTWGGESSCSFRPLPDWTKPTHIMEDHLLSPKVTVLNVNVIQKHYIQVET